MPSSDCDFKWYRGEDPSFVVILKGVTTNGRIDSVKRIVNCLLRPYREHYLAVYGWGNRVEVALKPDIDIDVAKMMADAMAREFSSAEHAPKSTPRHIGPKPPARREPGRRTKVGQQQLAGF